MTIMGYIFNIIDYPIILMLFPFFTLILDYIMLGLTFFVLGISFLIAIVMTTLVDIQDEAIKKDKIRSYKYFILSAVISSIILKFVISII